MKEKLLRAIYIRYRSHFYHFLTSEFLETMPQDVREPAMSFLAQGKDRLERWAYFMANFLQRRLVTDPDKIRTYEGMMLMLKLLLVHVNAYKMPTKIIGAPTEPEEEKVDPLVEIEKAMMEFRKGPKQELSPTEG